MKKVLAIITGLKAILFSAAVAQTVVSTSVVGFEKVNLPANTYTAIGINLNLNPVISATIAAVGSSSISLNGITNTGASLVSTEPYYLEVTSGNAAGTRLDLNVASTIAAASSSVVVDAASRNNTDPLANIAANLPGASVEIKKHITLADLAASITGLTDGTSGTGDEVLLLDTATGGFKTYLRRTSTTWRDENNNTVNSLPIPPGVGLIINKRAVAGSILSTGTIRANSFNLNTVPGYQLVTFGFPINHSPSSIGAVGTSSSSAAAGWTAGVASVADSIYTINSAGGFDQYFLRTGNSWRDGNNVTINSSEIMPSGGSFVVFKNANLNLELPKPAGL
jgi:hypothetical protein